ncbi:cyclic nucleotide-binding domain-containing protein [Devosia sp. Leaf64]|uniref:cyclic nucleotide-binding domain-containing protein n=1 Tax=Devosia sp. Leaf64 TaxID=1736229 RepID=UPI000715397B|nr:cyclic nucleotide-binding domain-containing protein [Devosia sp. Leaf64]KQN78279.1 cyclic nucleotide-binding protein [Devosia sp. Leaf64]
MRKVLYILGQLNDEDVEWMARTGRRIKARHASVLIEEGRATDDLFFVIGGEAVVKVSGVGEVARLGRGEVVGEMSLIDSAPPSVTVETTPGSLILAIDKRAIELRLRDEPGFAGRFYKALAIFLADRLRSTTNRQKSNSGMKAGAIMDDELDENILDQVSLAGARFDHMMSILSAARA